MVKILNFGHENCIILELNLRKILARPLVSYLRHSWKSKLNNMVNLEFWDGHMRLIPAFVFFVCNAKLQNKRFQLLSVSGYILYNRCATVLFQPFRSGSGQTVCSSTKEIHSKFTVFHSCEVRENSHRGKKFLNKQLNPWHLKTNKQSVSIT